MLCHVINRTAPCVKFNSLSLFYPNRPGECIVGTRLNRGCRDLIPEVLEQELLIDSDFVRNVLYAIPDLQSSFRKHKISQISIKHYL